MSGDAALKSSGKRVAPLRSDAAASKAAGRADDLTAERLLIEAAQRDRARFAELYEKNFERVYAYVAARVRDHDAAQDLTSDVFHSALAGLARFEWRGVPFAAWLLRIAPPRRLRPIRYRIRRDSGSVEGVAAARGR